MKMLLLILLQISMTLPNSTPEQLYTTSEQYYQTTGYRNEGPYRSPASTNEDGLDFDDDNLPDYPDGPMPIGDGLWILLALAAAYGVAKRRQRL